MAFWELSSYASDDAKSPRKADRTQSAKEMCLRDLTLRSCPSARPSSVGSHVFSCFREWRSGIHGPSFCSRAFGQLSPHANPGWRPWHQPVSHIPPPEGLHWSPGPASKTSAGHWATAMPRQWLPLREVHFSMKMPGQPPSKWSAYTVGCIYNSTLIISFRGKKIAKSKDITK